MLIYLVGMTEVDPNNMMMEPFYLGWTDNPNIADKYYENLVMKYKKNPANYTESKFTAAYFIRTMSKSVFDAARSGSYSGDENMAGITAHIDEIIEWPANVCMTEADYEAYMEEIYTTFDSVSHTLQESPEIADVMSKIKAYSKFTTNKKFRKYAKLFKLIYKYMREYFNDYSRLETELDLDKVNRKF